MLGTKAVKEKCLKAPLKVIEGKGYKINIYTIENTSIYFGIQVAETNREHLYRRQLRSDKYGVYFIYGSKTYI